MTTSTEPGRWRALRWIVGAACMLGLTVTCPRVGRATDVTTCGTTVAADDTAVLQADLTCDGYFGIRLLANSTLQLNGHSITGGLTMAATVLGVSRIDDVEPEEGGHGRFTIVGPGEIAGPGADPHFHVTTYACVAVQNGRAILTSPTGLIDIHGCTFGIAGYIYDYSRNRARVEIDHAAIHDNGQDGINVGILRASQVTAYGNHEQGLHGLRSVVVDGIDAHDNGGPGLFAERNLKGANVIVSRNYKGAMSFNRLALTNLTATDNTGPGVAARHATLVDSTVTGNGAADLFTATRPQLVNTTCGTSMDSLNQPMSWGVCAGD